MRLSVSTGYTCYNNISMCLIRVSVLMHYRSEQARGVRKNRRIPTCGRVWAKIDVIDGIVQLLYHFGFIYEVETTTYPVYKN